MSTSIGVMHLELGKDDTEWAGKTAPEIRNIGQKKGSVIVIPVGSTEQHGNHLPVSTDTILANAVAQTAAKRVSGDIPILVSPPIWHGFSPHHLPFGGTITLELKNLLDVLEDIGRSVLGNGFDSLLFINGHGGNMSTVNSAVKTVGDEFPDKTIHGMTYFQLASRFIDSIRESRLGGMSHGGEFETSLMLHLRPDLIKTDKIEGTPKQVPFEYESEDLTDGGELSTYRTFDEYSESGAIGAPGLATQEKGEKILTHLGDELQQLLKQLHQQHQ